MIDEMLNICVIHWNCGNMPQAELIRSLNSLGQTSTFLVRFLITHYKAEDFSNLLTLDPSLW